MGLPALGLTAFLTRHAATAQAATRSRNLFGDWLVLPASVLCLVSGPLLALDTPWGLAGHPLGLGEVLADSDHHGLSIFSLRPGINEAAARGSVDIDPVVAPSVATATFLFTSLSVLQPW